MPEDTPVVFSNSLYHLVRVRDTTLLVLPRYTRTRYTRRHNMSALADVIGRKGNRTLVFSGDTGILSSEIVAAAKDHFEKNGYNITAVREVPNDTRRKIVDNTNGLFSRG